MQFLDRYSSDDIPLGSDNPEMGNAYDNRFDDYICVDPMDEGKILND